MPKPENAATLDERCEALAAGSPTVAEAIYFAERSADYERCTLTRGHSGEHLGSHEKRWV